MKHEKNMKEAPPLHTLKLRIEKAKQAKKTRRIQKSSPSTTIGQFLNVGVEFVAGIVAGVAGGLFVDWMCGTSPWGLVSFFILGCAAGFLNVYRVLTKLPKS